jgi:hypothetical protein
MSTLGLVPLAMLKWLGPEIDEDMQLGQEAICSRILEYRSYIISTESSSGVSLGEFRGEYLKR